MTDSNPGSDATSPSAGVADPALSVISVDAGNQASVDPIDPNNNTPLQDNQTGNESDTDRGLTDSGLVREEIVENSGSDGDDLHEIIQAISLTEDQESDSPNPSIGITPLALSANLWQRNDVGSAVASQIHIDELIDQALQSASTRATLLAQYGLAHPGDSTPPPFSINQLDLASGQSGEWDAEQKIYRPSWDVAFSTDIVFFQLSFSAQDPLDPGYLIEGLTAEVALHFDRQGLDPRLLSGQNNHNEAIVIEIGPETGYADNALAILLAYAADYQIARRNENVLLPVVVAVQPGGSPITAFTRDAVEAVLEVAGELIYGNSISVPGTLSLELAEDSGADAHDGYTHNGTIRVHGLPEGLNWEYSIDAGNTWIPGLGDSFILPELRYDTGSIQVRLPLNNGYEVFNNIQPDTITIDATAPTIELGVDPINRIAGNDEVNTEEKADGLTISGHGEPESEVEIRWYGSSLMELLDQRQATVVDSDGNWSIEYETLNIPVNGDYTIDVTFTDRAGNRSQTVSRNLRIDAENIAPTLLELGPGAGIAKDLSADGFGEPVAGTLVGFDPDSIAPLSFTLGKSDEFDNQWFRVEGSTLRFIGGYSDYAAMLAANKTSLQVTVTVTDADGASLSRMLSIPFVDSSNLAPTADPVNASLAPISENSAASSISGASVSSLFEHLFTDPDADDPNDKSSFVGVALKQNKATASQGRWQFKALGSSNWSDIPALTGDSPYILLEQDLLRFVPASGFDGVPGVLEVHLLETTTPAWQRGFLANNQQLAVGGNNAASTELVALGTTILPVNKAPTGFELVSTLGINPDEDGVFATVKGIDPDTADNLLEYTFVKAIGKTSGDIYYDSENMGASPFSFNPLTKTLNLDTSYNENLINEDAIIFTIKVDDPGGSEKSITTTRSLGVLKPGFIAPRVVEGREQVQLNPIRNTVSITGAAVNPTGTQVGLLFQQSFSDIAPSTASELAGYNDSLGAVAIIDNYALSYQGAWQFRSEDGTFQSIPSVSETRPLIVRADSELRFLPRPGFLGTPGSLRVRLLEDTPNQDWDDGVLEGGVVAGGSGPATLGLVTVSASIEALPQAPTALAFTNANALENPIGGTLVGQLIGTDPDTTTSSLTYALVESSSASHDNHLVELNPVSGEIRLITTLSEDDQDELDDAVNRGYLRLAVSVSDGAGGGGTYTTNLVRLLLNSNNRAPIVSEADPGWPQNWGNRPVITSGNQVYLTNTYPQGTSSAQISGETVNVLFGSRFLDNTADSNTFRTFNGIAITNNGSPTNAVAGRWEYQQPGSSIWTALPANLTDQTPFLLASNAKLRFKPNASFNGVPPTLTVRLLDNSLPIPASGILNPDQPLLFGGSGAASTSTIELFTYIEPPALPQAPQSLSFAPAYEIIYAGDDELVSGESLLGTLVGYDPDTPADSLTYAKIEDSSNALISSGDNQGIPVLAGIDIFNGNQIRVKPDFDIPKDDLTKLRLRFSVSDQVNAALINTQPFSIPESRFTDTPDTTLRSESVVLPLTTLGGSFNQPVQFSATGSNGSLSVQPAGVLSGEDIESFIDVGSLNLGSNESLSEIVPLAPLLDFSINVDNPGDLVRFEFELPDLGTYAEYAKIRYLKLFANGVYDTFDYEVDGFGVGSGARLEQRINGAYVPVDSATSFTAGRPTYLAVYIQDNLRGDRDLTLGVVRDPGAPMLLSTVAIPVAGGGGGGGGGVVPPVVPPVVTAPPALDPPVEPTPPVAEELTRSSVPDSVQRFGIDLNATSFAVQGTAESDQVNVSNPDQATVLLGPGDDNLRVSRSARKVDVTVDAGAGDDVIHTRRGSDVVIAGDGDDVIRAASSVRPRGKAEAEVDVMAGGDGSDRFQLGEGRGSYYLDLQGRGQSSYALIADLSEDDTIELSREARDTYRIKAQELPGYPDVDGYALYSNKDLVAFIVLDDDNQDRALSLKDREVFSYRKD